MSPRDVAGKYNTVRDLEFQRMDKVQKPDTSNSLL
jgi:hypothetical protein